MSRHRRPATLSILFTSFALAVGVAMPAHSANAGHRRHVQVNGCCDYPHAGPVGAAGRARERDLRGDRSLLDSPCQEEKGGTGTGVPASTKGSPFYSGPAFYPGWRRW
jgi:hypothetical protein